MAMIVKDFISYIRRYHPTRGAAYPLALYVNSDGRVVINLYWFRIFGQSLPVLDDDFLYSSCFAIYWGDKCLLFITPP
jgi:hypothetical protein